jgi:hypothetical protein
LPRELQLTAEDRAWLRELSDAMPVVPRPVVSMDQYLAAIRSAEYATTQSFKTRRNLRRYQKLAGKLYNSRRGWRSMALALGVVAGVLVLVIVRWVLQ